MGRNKRIEILVKCEHCGSELSWDQHIVDPDEDEDSVTIEVNHCNCIEGLTAEQRESFRAEFLKELELENDWRQICKLEKENKIQCQKS
jgi:hypothetical protein